MMNVPEIFGSLVFNDEVMRTRLPEQTYKALKRTIERGEDLSPEIAGPVATAMKDWAIEKGATHYTHWFQPMTGITAEKHDSFISPQKDGSVIMEFSAKELIKGEPDASSLPSGGLRATFEARGYTAWDPTSYAFIKDTSLCIPTVFCSYGGEALDKKTPLLRSIEAVSFQAKRIVELFGNKKVKRVISNAGAEQEYFLVDKNLFDKRLDLVFCGRTLFGAKPPKGQELDDHYFGAIGTAVADYMRDLDETLWKLGVSAKTKHNETAPAQHELAQVYTDTNTASDNNQLTMEIMQKLAYKHGLVCLLHEKPFDGINGSGKHNNWSLSTDDGVNLLDPGKTPAENAQFILFLCAVIKGVDEYQELLRVSVATAGNDHRLGANEAPPAIISVSLGDSLTSLLESLESDSEVGNSGDDEMKLGVHAIPNFPKDTTDRNRTSPFAFTGTKFEFRMPGSALSVSDPNTVINTIVAEELRLFADELSGKDNFTEALNNLIKRTVTAHKRIIFNGDGYSNEWREEAKARGLYNLESTVDALPYLVSDRSIELFARHGVFSKTELYSRYDIMMQTYCKVINIEAVTAVQMTKRQILPAVSRYCAKLADCMEKKRSASAQLDMQYESETLNKLSELQGCMYQNLQALEVAINEAKREKEPLAKARVYRKKVFTAMQELRRYADACEELTERDSWPFPTYSELLYTV